MVGLALGKLHIFCYLSSFLVIVLFFATILTADDLHLELYEIFKCSYLSIAGVASLLPFCCYDLGLYFKARSASPPSFELRPSIPLLDS